MLLNGGFCSGSDFTGACWLVQSTMFGAESLLGDRHLQSSCNITYPLKTRFVLKKNVTDTLQVPVTRKVNVIYRAIKRRAACSWISFFSFFISAMTACSKAPAVCVSILPLAGKPFFCWNAFTAVSVTSLK